MHSGVCMAESLHCSPEIITTLFVNWLLKKKSKKHKHPLEFIITEYDLKLCREKIKFPVILPSPSLEGFRCGSDGKESACNAGDPGLIPGSVKIPWRRKWQPTLVFLPGVFHGQRSLARYSPWGHKELDTTERLTFSLFLEGCN